MDDIMTVESLTLFNDAWTRGDIPVLMSFIADECVYHASVGPEPGRTYVGRAAVEAGFRAMLGYDRGSESRSGRCFVFGDIGLAEWSYVTKAQGQSIETRGCDIFEFEGALIKRKDAFRKVLT